MSEKQTSALKRPQVETGSRRPGATVKRAERPVAEGSSRNRRAHSLTPAGRVGQARELQNRIAGAMAGADLDLTVTCNKTVMISVTRQPRHRRYKVRLHQMFVKADDRVMADLAAYIVHNDLHASRRLTAFIDSNPADEEATRRRDLVIRTEGRWYDLEREFDALNQAYFDGALTCRITWGRHVARGRARRAIRLGSFTLEDMLIRIHPGLDQHYAAR